jgi:hypothetical protein
MMTFDPAADLNDGLARAGWSVSDLWFAAFGLGGNLSQDAIRDITTGQRAVSRVDYDVLAAALNDEFADRGLDHPMPYWPPEG